MLYKGSSQRKSLYKGSSPKKKMYKGNTLVWSSLESWQKYNSQLQYTWRQYSVAYAYSEVSGGSGYGQVADNTMVYMEYSINNSNGTYNYLRQGYPGERMYSDPFYIKISNTTIRKCTQTGAGSGHFSYSYTDYNISSTASRGTYRGTVTSTSSSAYPTNGQSGSYWYDTRTSAYIQGSYVGVVEAEPNTYPSNGRHSDGYWYVLI